MKLIKQHLDDMFKSVPDSEHKRKIKQEIIENLEEKVLDLMKEGKDEEDAINKALIEFGDIEDIKRELGVKESGQKKHSKLNLSFSIWGSSLIIALFLFINFYYTPDIIWFVYPTFAVLWWPLSMLYVWMRTK